MSEVKLFDLFVQAVKMPIGNMRMAQEMYSAIPDSEKKFFVNNIIRNAKDIIEYANEFIESEDREHHAEIYERVVSENV